MDGWVDYSLSELFPQTEFLMQEMRRLQQLLAAETFRQRFEESLRQSSEINEQFFALSEVMKIWVKESEASLGPKLEARLMEKFQLLEHGLETQSGKLFCLINEQNRLAQERALAQGVGAASRAPNESEPAMRGNEDSLMDIRRFLERHEQSHQMTECSGANFVFCHRSPAKTMGGDNPQTGDPGGVEK